jgi:hypothetical protein
MAEQEDRRSLCSNESESEGEEIVFNPSKLIRLYNGRDEETQSNKWRFIEMSMAYTPLISDVICKIPDSDARDKDKYIRNAIKNCVMSEYVYKEDDIYGVWDFHKNKFYEFTNQADFKDELIEFLLTHTIASYNTPKQLSTKIMFPITIGSGKYESESDSANDSK